MSAYERRVSDIERLMMLTAAIAEVRFGDEGTYTIESGPECRLCTKPLTAATIEDHARSHGFTIGTDDE